MKCGYPPNFHDGTKCSGAKLPPGTKRCDWNDAHPDWGDVPVYNTNVTYECPEGYIVYVFLQHSKRFVILTTDAFLTR